MKKPGKDAMTTILGVVGGAVVGKMVIKMIPLENQMIKAFIPIAAGVMLAGNKSAIIKGAGLGMAAAGGLSLIEALAPGMLGAPGDEEIFLNGIEDEINGYYDEDGNFINAPDDDLFLSEPADQSIMSEPADQSIMSEPADQSIMSGYDDYSEMNAAEIISASFDME